MLRLDRPVMCACALCSQTSLSLRSALPARRNRFFHYHFGDRHQIRAQCQQFVGLGVAGEPLSDRAREPQLVSTRGPTRSRKHSRASVASSGVMAPSPSVPENTPDPRRGQTERRLSAKQHLGVGTAKRGTVRAREGRCLLRRWNTVPIEETYEPVADLADAAARRLRVDRLKWAAGKRNPKTHGDKLLHTGAQGLAVFLKLHNLSEVSAQSLPPPNGMPRQDLLQVIGPEGQFPKPCQRSLLPQQLHEALLLRVAQCTISERCHFGTFCFMKPLRPRSPQLCFGVEKGPRSGVRPSGGQIERRELTTAAGLPEDGSHDEASIAQRRVQASSR